MYRILRYTILVTDINDICTQCERAKRIESVDMRT
jgi:hypothetical protein